MTAAKAKLYGDETRRPPKPPFYGKAIPATLRPLRQWVCWKFAWKVKDSKWTKLPLDANKYCRSNAKSNDPKTWTDLQTAAEVASVKRRQSPDLVDGLGFMFAPDGGLFGLDIDGCRDATTGTLSAFARAIVDRFGTYAEVSPSGTGVKLIGRGVFPGTGRKVKLAEEQELELYNRERYFTITGDLVPGAPADVMECSAALNAVMQEHFANNAPDGAPSAKASGALSDSDIINYVTKWAKSAAEGERLWRGDTTKQQGDDSAADLALCNMLAFYCGPDPARIDSLFRQSGLMREKWNRADYRANTINKALEGKTEFFDRGGKGKGGGGGSVSTGGAAGAPRRNLTDLGNAERLIDRHGHDLHYSAALGWLVWNGVRWERDENGEVERRMVDTVRSIYQEAAAASDSERRERIARHATHSEGRSPIRAAIALAQSLPRVPVRASELDADPWLLNCPNGTVDLRTGKLREHRCDDLLTQMTPVLFDAAATCPLWERTLATVLPSEDVRGYVQRLFGYSLSGVVTEQTLPIFYGEGANGKSVLTNVLRAVLGDGYAMSAPSGFLMAARGERHPTETADLFGRRVVVASETGAACRLDEALVKCFTGGERIRARRMRQDFFEFAPTHKIILCTNHKPRVTGGGHGIWRRLSLVPFDVKLWNPDAGETGDEHLRQDKTLESKLLAELRGILAWAVRGCLQWQRDGLGAPAAVREATVGYRDEEDTVAEFLADEVHTGGGSELLACVYDAYKHHCDGRPTLGRKALSAELRRRGFDVRPGTGNKTTVFGLRLIQTTRGVLGSLGDD